VASTSGHVNGSSARGRGGVAGLLVYRLRGLVVAHIEVLSMPALEPACRLTSAKQSPCRDGWISSDKDDAQANIDEVGTAAGVDKEDTEVPSLGANMEEDAGTNAEVNANTNAGAGTLAGAGVDADKAGVGTNTDKAGTGADADNAGAGADTDDLNTRAEADVDANTDTNNTRTRRRGQPRWAGGRIPRQRARAEADGARMQAGADAVLDIFSGRPVARNKKNQGLIGANQTAGKAYHFRHISAIESKTPRSMHAKQIST
jgi:hypothetical protein